MFEVDVKNITEEEGRREGEEDQLGFGALIRKLKKLGCYATRTPESSIKPI